MTEMKISPTHDSVHSYINRFDEAQKRKDCHELLHVLERITGEQPVLWTTNIIGFGCFQFESKDGQQGERFLIGFTPKKQNITFYFMNGLSRYKDVLPKLGMHKTSKACLYIRSLNEIDRNILYQILKSSAHYMKKKYLNVNA